MFQRKMFCSARGKHHSSQERRTAASEVATGNLQVLRNFAMVLCVCLECVVTVAASFVNIGVHAFEVFIEVLT